VATTPSGGDNADDLAALEALYSDMLPMRALPPPRWDGACGEGVVRGDGAPLECGCALSSAGSAAADDDGTAAAVEGALESLLASVLLACGPDDCGGEPAAAVCGPR
jgi:hypothetical protein